MNQDTQTEIPTRWVMQDKNGREWVTIHKYKREELENFLSTPLRPARPDEHF